MLVLRESNVFWSGTWYKKQIQVSDQDSVISRYRDQGGQKKTADRDIPKSERWTLRIDHFYKGVSVFLSYVFSSCLQTEAQLENTEKQLHGEFTLSLLLDGKNFLSCDLQ